MSDKCQSQLKPLKEERDAALNLLIENYNKPENAQKKDEIRKQMVSLLEADISAIIKQHEEYIANNKKISEGRGLREALAKKVDVLSINKQMSRSYEKGYKAEAATADHTKLMYISINIALLIVNAVGVAWVCTQTSN